MCIAGNQYEVMLNCNSGNPHIVFRDWATLYSQRLPDNTVVARCSHIATQDLDTRCKLIDTS
jgi:hypothetical protein